MAPENSKVRYDRQLRLWGDHGQLALENAKICVIGASALGTEILKNCILPGICGVTIIDNRPVTSEHIENNFFLTRSDLGKPLAVAVGPYLQPLNEDVHFECLDVDFVQLIDQNPEFFNNFATVVLAMYTVESNLLKLSNLLWKFRIPCLICCTNGWMGYLRLAVAEHTVIESHPDSEIHDLRLDCPFELLQEYCDSLDLNQMTKEEHMHVPWLILLYKFTQDWMKLNNGQFPSSFQEKKSLKQLIENEILRSPEGVPLPEENFDEALRAVNSSVCRTVIPSSIKDILNDPCTELHSESSNFWFMVKAMRIFVENEGNGNLPLRGSIPDMTSDSKRYIYLQTAYLQESNKQIAQIRNYLNRLLTDFCRKPESISDFELKNFCKNSAFLRVVRTSQLEKEFICPDVKQLAGIFEDNGDGAFYIVHRAAQKFFDLHKKLPGFNGGNSFGDNDIGELRNCFLKLLQEWALTGVSHSGYDDVVAEFCRWGGAELHSVAAFMGGVAGHEIIKLVTKQYVPICTTFIYNGIRQTSLTLNI